MRGYGRPLAAGLTLVELLVALTIMATLALLSWRAVDGMSRTQSVTREHADQWLNWQTALAQWQTDLDAVQDPGVVPALDFDGRVLRLVRRAPPAADGADPGLTVVAWAILPGPPGQPPAGSGNPTRWVRWAAPPTTSRASLGEAWAQAERWSRTPTAADAPRTTWLPAVTSWQLYYHRGGAWSNPLSATGVAEAPTALPDGIRLVLTLPAVGQPTGELTLDWVSPTLGGGKSA